MAPGEEVKLPVPSNGAARPRRCDGAIATCRFGCCFSSFACRFVLNSKTRKLRPYSLRCWARPLGFDELEAGFPYIQRDHYELHENGELHRRIDRNDINTANILVRMQPGALCVNDT